MKKIIFIAILVIAFGTSLFGQSLLTENFDYPVGDSITIHGWTTYSGSGYPVYVVSPGLVYTNYPLSNIGNAARLGNFGQDYYKPFTAGVTEGTLYAAFMAKFDTVRTGDYFAAFLPSTSTSFYTCRIFVKDSLGGVSFGIGKTATSRVYSAPSFALNTTYLLIAKYSFESGTGDDSVKLYVFTSPVLPGTEPSTPTAGPDAGGSDATELGRFSVRQGTSTSSPNLIIDGIKVSTTWTGIITEVKSLFTVPDNFDMSQNYPNPFNPTTKIKFSLPQNGFVTLKVYNILGEEVNTLINGNYNSGVYETEFNAGNLSSGMYFYRINYFSTDGKSFSDTKKLILVK